MSDGSSRDRESISNSSNRISSTYTLTSNLIPDLPSIPQEQQYLDLNLLLRILSQTISPGLYELYLKSITRSIENPNMIDKIEFDAHDIPEESISKTTSDLANSRTGYKLLKMYKLYKQLII
jgi:hypothetical protein